MNAVNPVQSSSDAGAAEPSMEEILASIRRIIADDGAPPRLLAPADREPDGFDASHGPTTGDPADDAASIERSMVQDPHQASADIASPTPEPALQTLRTSSEVEGTGPVELDPVPPIPPLPPRDRLGAHGEGPHDAIAHDDAPRAEAAPTTAPQTERLVSAAADSAVTAAFNTLAASRLVDNSERLTGLVREMIGPFVKAWVDEHLPGMVERLVVAEIERMAGR